MKIIATIAAATLAGLTLVGTAEAMPVGPAGASQAPIVDAAVVVTKTVRRGPFGGRVVTRRVVRRPMMRRPMMGRTVTTTHTVR